MIEEIPKSIMLKKHFKLYKSIKPNFIKETGYQIYNYICNVDQSLHKHIEIEVKFGQVKFEGNFKLYEYIKESFLIPQFTNNKDNKITFESNIPNYFYLIWYYVNKEIDLGSKEIIPLPPKVYKEFIYQDKRRSFCFENNKLISEEVILKKNKHHINIKSSNSIDYRITSCIEYPQKVEANDSIKSYREKMRVSYKFQYFRLDFTIVKSIYNFSKRNINFTDSISDTIANIQAEDFGFPAITYELEYEFDELYQFLQQTKYDYIQFENIIGRMIENINILINTCNSETFMTFLNNESNDSLYGNYFKYNLN